jgi:hypothetical protein
MNAPVHRTNFVPLQKNAWPALPNSSEGVKTGNVKFFFHISLYGAYVRCSDVISETIQKSFLG